MTFQQFLSVVEIRTKIVSLSTFFIACMYIFLGDTAVSPGRLLLLLAAVLMVDMGTTAFNSFFDYYKGVDSRELEREQEKVLVYQGVAPGAAFLTAAALFAGAGIIGIYLVYLVGWPLLILGILSFFTGILYSGGPRPISHTAFGEIFAGGFLGMVLFIIVRMVLEDGSVSPGEMLPGLPSTMLIAAILTVNNSCDLEADRKAGRKTLSILIGRKASAVLILLLVLGAFGLQTWFSFAAVGGMQPAAALPVLAAGAASLVIYGRMVRSGLIQSRKGPSMQGISRIFLLFTSGVLIGGGISLI
ncbi:prenyltransferase [Salinispira pacifica]|uniref:1,4-dihydroxy-2-naphthoate polyprenyltransferase n=1 Tax=Salinispira pacifica TaxID=1307761 RepID=V5WLE9_9SPIO|nr:prenyltransferase [Salinispira pacifica]AHC16404.1 1,4-dihydroxy-2-naphthoate polyprenyltransferase [Salinispira pacifica]